MTRKTVTKWITPTRSLQRRNWHLSREQYGAGSSGVSFDISGTQNYPKREIYNQIRLLGHKTTPRILTSTQIIRDPVEMWVLIQQA